MKFAINNKSTHIVADEEKGDRNAFCTDSVDDLLIRRNIGMLRDSAAVAHLVKSYTGLMNKADKKRLVVRKLHMVPFNISTHS